MITIAVAAAARDGLAAYGTVLRYGKHEKRLTACYSIASHELAMMEGVYAGLRAVNRPSEIMVVIGNDIFPSCLQMTPFEHLRQGTAELEELHKITWRAEPDFPDLHLCLALAEESILKYQDACELASPALPSLKLAAQVFFLPENTPVIVQSWLSKTDAGDVWGEAVEVTLDRIKEEPGDDEA